MVRAPPGLQPLQTLDEVHIVIDIGLTYTKCGFVKDSMPKHIVPTPLTMVEELRNHLSNSRQNSFSEMFENRRKLAMEVEEFLA